MTKQLSDLTQKELWKLFPIQLCPYNEKYPLWFQSEKKSLEDVLNDDVLRVSHIGSTAVKGLTAKPIIDILLEVRNDTSFNQLNDVLLRIGYINMNKTVVTIPKMYVKGYTLDGFEEKVFHLHVRYLKDHKELYFRDYLRDYPSVQKDYTDLKQSLLNHYEHHRDNYTNGKTEFITKYTEKAMRLYKNRYNKSQSL